MDGNIAAALSRERSQPAELASAGMLDTWDGALTMDPRNPRGRGDCNPVTIGAHHPLCTRPSIWRR